MRHAAAFTAALITLAAGAEGARAQDKAKGEIGYAADYRLRDTYLENEAAKGNESPAHSNRLDQRLRLNLNLRASERLGATASILSAMQFGQTAGEPVAEPKDGLSVNQAFGNWMISDDFIFKFGRMNYQIGDGFVMGVNEWEAVPYAFDGALFHYEFEFGRLEFFGFKMREYGAVAVAGGLTEQRKPDLEHNAYGFTFDLKTMPEVLKTVHLHVIKDAADRGVEAPAAGTQVQTIKGTQGIDAVRYGVNVGLVYGAADLKLWYAGVGGKNKYPLDPTLPYHGSYDIESNMVQAELGFSRPEWHAFRAFVQYHRDTGDGDSTDGREQTYDSYFHIKHASAGFMDLFDWGNLTSVQIGLTAKTSEALDLGVSYWLLNRTATGQNSSRPLAGLYGGNLVPVTGTNDLNLMTTKLGDEFDLWAEYRLANGLTVNARVGYFSPGPVFDTARSGGVRRDDGIVQAMLEGKVSF